MSGAAFSGAIARGPCRGRAMSILRGCFLGLLFVSAAEGAAWLVLVPSTVLPVTFLWMNLAALCMFLIGFASAANGLQTPSIAQVLHEIEATPRVL
jgi:hypothetical protein